MAINKLGELPVPKYFGGAVNRLLKYRLKNNLNSF